MNQSWEILKEKLGGGAVSLALLVFVCLGHLGVHGSSLEGHVRHAETGRPIEGATVFIEGSTLASQRENARLEAASNRAGRYQFKDLAAGEYRLSATLPGFADSSRLKVELGSEQVLRQDFELVPVAVSGAYRVEPVPLPGRMSPEISGVDFSSSGRIAVCNRQGEVWVGEMKEGAGDWWRRFAYGLYEPFGIAVESDAVIYVIQRPEITRLTDVDGDGRADRYETVNEGWGMTGNYHEFAYGLSRDSQGNFYLGLGMASAGEFGKVRGPLRLERVIPWDRPERMTDHHRSVARYQGWVLQVRPDGGLNPLATGFRQPLGMGISPEDELFVTDVAGSWVPSSVLVHAREGGFYGHPDGLKWDPSFAGAKVTTELLAALRTPPSVVLPHGRLGTSPGEPVWDMTGGKFGPFEGQVFIGDVTRFLMRVFLEKVNGEYQGAAFPFMRNRGLRPGNMRSAFGPDGQLYLGQTIRGWREAEEGLQRVVWTGANPVEMLRMQLTGSGFRLEFTERMDGELLSRPDSYELSRFQYHYHILDGSVRINETAAAVMEANAGSNGRVVELVLENLWPGYIYELRVPDLRSVDGKPLDNPTAYYTLNRTLSGERFQGAPKQAEADEGLEGVAEIPDVALGGRVYGLYCAPCHHEDGSGSEIIRSASFIGEESPLGKADEELLRSIAEGAAREGEQELAMPAFGQALTSHEMRSVLAYLRAEFGRN